MKLSAQKLNDVFSKLFGRRFVRTDTWYHYNQWHRQSALQAVKTIETYNGQKLSPQSKRKADEYAVEILGGLEYAPWLYVYALVAEEFKEGWMPDNFFGQFVVPNANKDLRSVTAFKTFSNVVLRAKELPDIAYYIDGIPYNKELQPTDINSLRKLANGYSEIFVKKDKMDRGEGVMKVSPKDISSEKFNQIGDCVIQAPIQQHDFFNGIISTSVTTVRLTTVKNLLGQVELRASYLRVGRAGTEWVQSDNSVRIAVRGDGELDPYGYTSDWRRWRKHPDTNFEFSGHRVPQFQKAVETCIRLHATVPHFTFVGWDVAVDKREEIKLIEWNGEHADIKFSEATTGPCFVGLNWERFKKQ